eukprot:EG_transcript_25231
MSRTAATLLVALAGLCATAFWTPFEVRHFIAWAIHGTPIETPYVPNLLTMGHRQRAPVLHMARQLHSRILPTSFHPTRQTPTASPTPTDLRVTLKWSTATLLWLIAMLTGRILAARAPADGHGAPQVRRWHLCTVATDNSGHRLPDEGLPSGCVLHVSGLPWHTPVPVVCASLSHFCEDFGISAPVAIHVRPVSDSTSARDQGKQHLGSARLVFPDPAAAAAALRALQTTPPPPGFPASLRAQYHVPPT